MTAAPVPGYRDVELSRLIALHRVQLNAFCSRFCDDPHDRDELAQLVMIRVWNGFDGFDRRATFTTWLFQIVRNTAISEYAAPGRRPLPVDTVGQEGALLWRCSPVSIEDAVVLRDDVVRALDGIDERFRRTVELVDRWGCTTSEVAALTGVAEATVRTRLFPRAAGGPRGHRGVTGRRDGDGGGALATGQPARLADVRAAGQVGGSWRPAHTGPGRRADARGRTG